MRIVALSSLLSGFLSAQSALVDDWGWPYVGRKYASRNGANSFGGICVCPANGTALPDNFF